jgi:Na+-driven multidrug efflux pump
MAYKWSFQVKLHFSQSTSKFSLEINLCTIRPCLLCYVISGVARGCGWQHIGAYVNLAAFYLCGVPVAAILGLWLQLKARGLWIGIQVGAILQTVLLSLITSCTNWEKQVCYPDLIP